MNYSNYLTLDTISNLFFDEFEKEYKGVYRFSFNGQEKDDEWTSSTGSHLDFGARIYDSRIGRWLAVDPLASKYPFLTPYQFAGNNPIPKAKPKSSIC